MREIAEPARCCWMEIQFARAWWLPGKLRDAKSQPSKVWLTQMSAGDWSGHFLRTAPRNGADALRESWGQRPLFWRKSLGRMGTRSWTRSGACFAGAQDIGRSTRRFLI